MAYSNMAQLRMLASDHAAATVWGDRAIELAEELGETEILVARAQQRRHRPS